MVRAGDVFAVPCFCLGRSVTKEIRFRQRANRDLSRLYVALERLALAVPQIKKNILNACAETVAANGILEGPEAELLRAIADSLDCPIPPFIPAQSV